MIQEAQLGQRASEPGCRRSALLTYCPLALTHNRKVTKVVDAMTEEAASRGYSVPFAYGKTLHSKCA